jgi:hypothetical protein
MVQHRLQRSLLAKLMHSLWYRPMKALEVFSPTQVLPVCILQALPPPRGHHHHHHVTQSSHNINAIGPAPHEGHEGHPAAAPVVSNCQAATLSTPNIIEACADTDCIQCRQKLQAQLVTLKHHDAVVF